MINGNNLGKNSPRARANMLVKLGVGVLVVIIALVIVVFLIASYSDDTVDFDINKVTYAQLDEPREGQEIAIFTTSMGEFTAMLFPENAPKTVENFKKLVNEGYYNDSEIFRGEPPAYCLGGLQKVTENENKETFEMEASEALLPFKGAIASLGTGKKRPGGDKLMFINSLTFTEADRTELLKNEEIRSLGEKYLEYGGVPNFVGRYSIFAQVYDGMDVVEKISSSEVDDKTKLLTEKVTINKVELSTYSKK